MGKYAERTKVPVMQTQGDIKKLVDRYGADQYFFGESQERAVIGFTMADRQVRFSLPIADVKGQGPAERQRWRALFLVIKAKLESVESGIETFDEAFLAQVVLPDGTRVGDWAKEQVVIAYEGGTMPALLPGPASG